MLSLSVAMLEPWFSVRFVKRLMTERKWISANGFLSVKGVQWFYQAEGYLLNICPE